MKNALSLPSTILLAATLVPAVLAQSGPRGIEGTFTITNKDGSPLHEDFVFEVTVYRLAGNPGCYLFFVTRDRIEGQGEPDTGPESVPGEDGTLVRTGVTTYEWVNERGTTGTVTEDPSGDCVSEVTSGPNAGTQRLWNR